MTTADPTPITSDDRLLATLAHFFGLFGGLVVWATNKDKSRFVKFQALQSMAFGGVLTVVMMLAMLCLMGVMFLGILGSVLASTQPNVSPQSSTSIMTMAMLWPMSFLCIMPVSYAAALVQMSAAIAVATGHNWRYPIIAPRVEAYLQEPTNG